MTLADTQQQRLPGRLRHAGDQPVSLPSCAPAGLTSQPPSVSELELNEYAIERVYDPGRLVGAGKQFVGFVLRSPRSGSPLPRVAPRPEIQDHLNGV